MLKVSDAFNDAFAASGRELRARVTIGKSVYSSDDLTSVAYDSGAMTGEQFSIGSTYMNSAKITFSHLVEGLKQLDEVLLEFGIVKVDGSTEYVKMGTFIIDDKIQMDRNNNSTTIECMDRMVMLGGAYKSKLSYPATIKSVAVEIANMAGVKVNDTSFARLPNQSINEPVGYSYRDAIGIIAQFAMGFALFDRDGYLDIRTLVDSEFKIDPSQYFLKGLVKNETFFKLNGISCTVVTTSKDENGNETSKTTVLQSGSSSGSQIKLANNVMTQDVLDRMYESLKFTNYYPFTLNWNGNPAVEAGDWLTLEDMQGNEFKVPNMSYTLTYNGGLTASSKAETSTNSSVTYSYGGSMSNIVNEIGGREGAEGNHIYEGTEDQKPLFPKEGDLWYKHVGPDTEEWIYKDGKWEFLTSTKPATDAQKAADAAQKEAEEAKKRANESVATANDAVAKAGFANDTATQAKSDAATALQKALDAYAHGDKIKNGLTVDIDAVKGQVELKASQIDVDKLGGRVTSAEAQIKLQADQIALSVSKTELTNVLGSYATQTWTQGQIKTTADQIKLSVTQVQSNLDSLTTGAPNLVRNSGRFENTDGWLGAPVALRTHSYYKNGKTNLLVLSDTSSKEATTLSTWFDIKGGVTYTLQFDGFANNHMIGADVFIMWRKYNSPSSPGYDGYVMPINNRAMSYSYCEHIEAQFKLPPEAQEAYIRFDNNGSKDGVQADLWLADIKVAEETKGSPWSPAEADKVGQVQYASLEVKVNGIQSTVQGKADKSQITQLANQITSVVTNSPNPNLISNSGKPRNLNFWSSNHPNFFTRSTHAFYQGGREGIFGLWNETATVENTASTTRFKVKPGKKYTISMLVFGGSNVLGVDVFLLCRKANSKNDFDDSGAYNVGGNFKPNPSYAEYKSWTITIGDFDEAYFRIDNNGNTAATGSSAVFFNEVKVEEGDVATPWKDDHTSTEITQTIDLINLRVEKDKVVNQINISTEGILIDGKKVHITGQTSIDNAVIKDAMIANVTADKITAGTINAANVNVINLNAANITTGTLKGTNLSMNLNTGEILFQKGSIKSTNGNLNIDINDGSMAVLNGQDGFYFKDGKLSLSSDWAGNNSFGESNFGSIEYSHSLFGSSGMLVRGNGGLLLGTNKYKENVWVSNVVESGIAITPKGVSLQSEGKVSILAGTKTTDFPIYSPPFISVGTDMDTGIGNRIQIYAEYVHIPSAYRHTDSGSANVVVAADGALVRSTSASKYKTDIIRTNATDYGDKLLNLPTATWTDIAETKRYRDDPANQMKPTRNFGMIAEDLAEAGLEMLVVRGTDGELEGINYDRIGPALIPVIAKLKNEVETLKQQLEEKTA